MHRFWQIPELVLELLTRLPRQDNLSGPIDRRNLALTCRTIWAVVMPEVWRWADAKMLRSVLPTNVELARRRWSVRSRHAVRISRAVQDADWDPIKAYGCHIYELHLHDFRDSSNVGAYLELASVALSQHPRPEEMFPSLRSVIFEPSYPRSARAIAASSFPQILSPAISIRISDSVMNNPSAVHDMVKAFVPSGKTHTLLIETTSNTYSQRWPRELQSAIQSLILQFSGLTTLTLNLYPYGTPLLSSAARLSSLARLTMDLDIDDDLQWLIASSDAFPSLEVLKVGPIDSLHAGYVDLFKAITSKSLAEVELRSVEYNDFTALHIITEVIADVWPTKFMKLTIHLCGYSENDEIPPLMEPLLPLTSSSGLQFLGIHMHCGAIRTSFTDQDFVRISNAWPDLRCLHVFPGAIAGEFQSTWTPQATPQALVTLAKRCNRLEELSIPVDFDGEDLKRFSRDAEPCRSLVTYRDSYPLKTRPPKVVKLLRKLFPRMQYMYSADLATDAETLDEPSRGQQPWRGGNPWNRGRSRRGWGS